MAPRAVEIAVATRPYPGESANGDACQVDWYGKYCRIAVIDGLGHGPAAADAAAAACQILAAHPELAPEPALRACHATLVRTRGAAMAVARIDLSVHELIYAGVGNVEGSLWQTERSERLVAYRGIVGATFPRVRAFSFELGRQWLLLMHTDGIRTHRQEPLLEQPMPDLERAAESILDRFGRSTDDATVLLARPAPMRAEPT